MKYRFATIEDADKIYKLYQRLSAEDIYYRFFSLRKIFKEDIIRNLTSKDKIIVVAEVNGEIVGEVTLCGDGEFGIVVDPRYRNHGIGYNLLKFIINEAKKLGLPQIKFYALATNTPMIKLGKKLGFKIVYNGDGEVLGILDLRNYYN
ncbi:MAG: GNAT family N-acetyltransferase [Sulfolobaceae archaeon]